METTTIEQDFAAAMLYAEEKHGRGFQAKVSAKSGVDSSNLNSIMKHGKGTKEAVRRKIFEAVAWIVPGLPVLSPTQIGALLDFCCVSKSERLYCYVLLLLHTAMRPSEAAGLRWDQVQENIIDLTETKTDPRRVPMTIEIKEMLLKMHREGKYVFLSDPLSKQVMAQPYRFFRKAFENACREAGLNGFSLYGLRHSAASYLIMNGVDIRTVAEIMGHRNLSQTMRYTHFLDAHRIEAIQAIGKLGR